MNWEQCLKICGLQKLRLALATGSPCWTLKATKCHYHNLLMLLFLMMEAYLRVNVGYLMMNAQLLCPDSNKPAQIYCTGSNAQYSPSLQGLVDPK